MQSETGILIYQTEDGNTKIDVRLENETVWMTQKAIAELYQSSRQNINLHIKNTLEEKELGEDSVVKFYLTTAKDGKNYKTKHYNLQMIIAIGYRVRSHRGTQFRQWATTRLNEYLVKGFTMDDGRLKEMRNFGQDYFDELLERIRDISASEKKFYQKITAIYATAIDYDPNAEITQEFFVTIYNKLHFAIHGQTTAELIAKRAKATNENMGLTSWKVDNVRQQDVTVARNYLMEDELKSLNQIVTMYLDYARLQAERQRPMYMKDWTDKLNAFLKFNNREILQNAGEVSKSVAEKIAIQEYEKYNQNRIEQSSDDDFEQFIRNSNLKD